MILLKTNVLLDKNFPRRKPKRNQIPKCKFTPNLHNICKNGKFSKIDHIYPNWTSTMAKTQGRVV